MGKFFAEGSYYIESISNQLAAKGLALFQQLEKNGGFLKLLKDGVIQQKITEKARKEQASFDAQELRLIGNQFTCKFEQQNAFGHGIVSICKKKKHKNTFDSNHQKSIVGNLRKGTLRKRKKIASRTTNKDF